MGLNLPQDPVIPHLGIYPNDSQSYYRNICSIMFIAALFVIARIWKQPRCPSMEEWIKKAWNIYTLEYYSVVKNKTKQNKNEILNFEYKWMEIENTILSEITQTQNDEYGMYPHRHFCRDIFVLFSYIVIAEANHRTLPQQNVFSCLRRWLSG